MRVKMNFILSIFYKYRVSNLIWGCVVGSTRVGTTRVESTRVGSTHRLIPTRVVPIGDLFQCEKSIAAQRYLKKTEFHGRETGDFNIGKTGENRIVEKNSYVVANGGYPSVGSGTAAPYPSQIYGIS
jgi:hypothetical protein